MTGKPLTGFKSLEAHHCVTGSMRHIYAYHGHDVSEDLLLGIGGGVGFVYWHMKRTDPFIGGRAKGKPGQGFEVCVGQRTGVTVDEHTTSSARKAEKTLLDLLDQGRPVMLQVDMGFLPYLDFGGVEYHFGAHAVVAAGYDPDSRQVLIADRDKNLHPVSLENLARARGSKHKPFPPKHRWYTFDFGQRRHPGADEVWAAIAEQANEMLEPPISNFGVKGIRKTARRAPKWPDQMDEEGLRRTLFNCYIFIDAEGGSGGGIFRYMFSRFLRQAAEITGEASLGGIADAFWHIGDRWQGVAEVFKTGWAADDPVTVVNQAAGRLPKIADLEEAAWGRLYDLVN